MKCVEIQMEKIKNKFRATVAKMSSSNTQLTEVVKGRNTGNKQEKRNIWRSFQQEGIL